MLRYMLDTSTCIYVIKNRPASLRHRFNELADQLCISIITFAELIYGAEKSARPHQNLTAVEQFCARLEVLQLLRNALPFITASCGRSSNERARRSGPTT
jgi:tRNA(fMet)-specific endonuclease VapC